MNYKNRDDELIKKQRHLQDQNRIKVTQRENAINRKVYSGKALDALAKGQYGQLREQSRPKVQPKVQQPVETSTPRVPELRNTTKNLREQGFPGSYNNDPIDFNYVLKNDRTFGKKGLSLNTLNVDADARRRYGRRENPEANEMYYRRFGKSQNEVLDEYEKYLMEKHPIINGVKDFLSAPDRALASAAGTLSHKFLPYSDLDQMLNSDFLQSKNKEVQRRRDYIADSDKLTEGQKAGAKMALEGGDFLTNMATANLLGGGLAVGDAAAGIGASIEPAKWLLPFLNGTFAYGGTAENTRHDLEKQGIDRETATDYANTQGLIWGGIDALTAGAGSKAGAAAKIAGKSAIQTAVKSAAKGFGVGVGKQAASEIANKLILGDQGTFSNDVQKYMDSGLNEDEATTKAFGNILVRAAGSGLLSSVLAGTTSLAGSGLSKMLGNNASEAIDDGLNEVFRGQTKIGMNDPLALPQNDIPSLEGMNQLALTGPRQAYPMTGTQGIIPMPGTNGTIQLPDTANQVAKVANQVAASNPRLVIPLEGEKLANAQARVKELKNTIKGKKTEVNYLKEAWQNASQKNKKAANQKYQASKAELEAMQAESKELELNIKGGTRKAKDLIKTQDKDLYNDLYGRKNGMMDNINYVVKYAGDTPEAKELGKAIKNTLEEYVETGDAFNTVLAPENIANVAKLDDLAKTVNKTYANSTFGEWFGDYNANTDTFENPSIWNGLYANDRIERINKFHQGLAEQGKTSGQSAPAQAPSTNNVLASDQDRVNKLISSSKDGSVELDNGQVIEKYSMKYMKDTVLKEVKKNGLPDGEQLDIRYKDGTEIQLSSGDDTSNIKLNNIDSIVWRNDSTDAFAGNNVSIYPDTDNVSDVYWRVGTGVYEPKQPQAPTRSHKDLIPENPFYESDSYKGLEANRKQAETEIKNLENTKKELYKLLKKEEIGAKSKEEMTPDDRISAMFWLDDNPVKYTAEGEKISKSISDIDNRIEELKSRLGEISEGQDKIRLDARAAQLQNYKYSDPVPATNPDLTHFKVPEDIQKLVDSGKAYIAEMSPLEYLQRAAYDIFDESTLENTIRSANSYDQIGKFAEDMRNGDKFPITYLDYRTKSGGRGQEGLTRSLAAYEAGIDKMPVAILNKPSANPKNTQVNYTPVPSNIPEADLEKAVAESVASSMDPAHQLAERYASAYGDFDAYDDMDNIFDNDSFVESMANDIESGRDLTQYITALEDMIDDAPDAETETKMQGLINELTVLNEGRGDGQLTPEEVAALEQGIRELESEGVDEPTRLTPEEQAELQRELAEAGFDWSEPTPAKKTSAKKAPAKKSSAKKAPAPEAPAPETATTSPDKGYWLRILGDDNFLTQQAQEQNVPPQTLLEYAAKNLGYEAIPRVAPNGGNEPPRNDIPHVDGTIPGEEKVSQTYTNTGKNGGGWNEEEYDKYTDPSNYTYETIDEEQSVQRASDMRRREGREAFKDRVLNKERVSSEEIDGLMMEWRELTEEARALEKAGENASEIWKESNRIFRKIQTQSTSNAQALQALAKWSRNTPEGMLVEAENIINGKKKIKKTGLQKELDKFVKDAPKFQFSEKFVKEFLTDAEELRGLTGSKLDTAYSKRKMAELGRKVNAQLPASLGEKVTTFLMDNMLGNFRTLITRNAGGNVGLNIVEQTLQRPLAAGIDSLVSLKTGRRTQAGLSREALAEYIQGFGNGLRDELSDLRTGLHTARSGENTLANAIKNNRHVFKNPVQDRLDSLVKNGLSVGDRPFYEAVYKQTLGDYNRLRQRGVMGHDIQKLSDEKFKEFAKTAAQLNALGAVYQQDTLLSKSLLKFKDAIGDFSRGVTGVDVLSQFSMPFVKTPANVIERGIDYSPLGLVRNAVRTGMELHNDDFDQNRFANETSRNILGTGLMAAGAAGLAASGALSGSFSEDKDEKQAQKEAGEQEYAWNVPEAIPFLGGKQMDIGWAPVVGSNLVAAAAAYDAYKKGDKGLLENLTKGAEAGGKAMFDQSMFQGLQRLFGSSEAYDSDKNIVANMGEVFKSGLSQFIPSLARQAGQVKDTYQRDIGNSNKDLSFGPFGNYDINSIMNNIPVLREKQLAPKVNTSGELVKENQGRNVGMKILEDMILPGKLTDVNYSRLSEEAKRLSDLTTNKTSYMPKADRTSVDTEGHTLSNQEWTDYQQKYYKTLTSAGERLLDSTYYKNAQTSEQEKMLAGVYSDLRSAINHEYNGKEVDGAAKRYVDAGGGDKGILEVLKYEMNSIEANKLDMTVPTYEKKQAEYPGGAKQYAADKKAADALGLSVETYTKQEKEYKGGAEKYAEDKKELDAINEKYGTELTMKTYSKNGKAGTEQRAIETKEAQDVGMVTKDGAAQPEQLQKAKDKAGPQWRKLESDLPTLKGMGLDTSAIYTYASAIRKNGSINPSEFANTYKQINLNTENGMTQDEVLAYLNKGNYTQDEAMDIWTTYGEDWKQVPTLVGGTWKKKKAKKK